MKSRLNNLLSKSISAMIAAIEIYNKPDFRYRGETFAILAINSWELMLKAKFLQENNNNIRSLYVYISEKKQNRNGVVYTKKVIKKTRSGNPYTQSIDSLAKKLMGIGHLNSTVVDNIYALMELRDSAIHFYNYSLKFNVRIQEIGAASLKNYILLYKDWFGKDLSNYNFYLMPLSFVVPEKCSDVMVCNRQEKNFFSFVEQLGRKVRPDSNFNLILNVDVSFSKSTTEDDIKVALSHDANAIPIVLTDNQIKAKYPMDYSMLTKRCKERYWDFVLNTRYHKLRKECESDSNYVYIRYLDPGKKNGSQKKFFSEAIFSLFDKYYTKK